MLLFKNKPIINHIVETLQPLVDDLLIVSNHNNKYHFTGVKEIYDIYPEVGPLGGIHAGLTAATYDYAFVISCDMPFIDAYLVDFLIEQSSDFDITVPDIDGKLQPLFAVYSKKCLPYIENCLNQHVYKVLDLFPMLKVNYVTNLLRDRAEANWVFFNVNTPNDYHAIQELRKEM